jgi:hypothetical protein
MRLSWRDWLATAFVAVGAIYYAMFMAGTDALGASTPELVAGVVLICGFVASFTAVVYGVGEGLFRANKIYLAITSLLGLAALATGVGAILSGNEAALATLVASTVLLWVMSTVRHAMGSADAHAEGRISGPLPGAA